MHFELDPDHRQLQDSLRRLLDTEGSFERRRQAAAGRPGWNRALWLSLAELGVTAMALPEEHGGFGQPPVALLPVLQELGRALALEPFLASAILGATAVLRAGSASQQRMLLPGLASGAQVFAFAHQEAGTRHARRVATTAHPAGDGWRLDGRKELVLHGADADHLVVSARLAGAPDERAGVALFLVRPDQAGVQRTALRLIDDTPAAEIRLAGAGAQLLGDAAQGPGALDAALDAGVAAVCAEALGVAERTCALTTEYVQTRQQFGRTIGSNQAVRHRVAEMRVALDMVRSAAMAGLLALEIGDAAQRGRELARAKMLVSRHGTFLAQQGIQLHGGVGMTTDYAVGHCLRRMTVIEQLFGDGATHAAALGAALAGDRAAA